MEKICHNLGIPTEKKTEGPAIRITFSTGYGFHGDAFACCKAEPAKRRWRGHASVKKSPQSP